MALFPPYIIEHIFFEKTGLNFHVSLQEDKRYYLVLWWKEIPLGELFIEFGQPSGKDLQDKIFDAIAPTIDSYLSRQPLSSNYKTALLERNDAQFAIELDKIFSSCNPDRAATTLDVSVVICTRNRSSYLSRCLISLQNQQFWPREIIVVDNAPTDESTREVVEQFKHVIYHREPRPGLDIARNAGAKKASASIITYVDDDVLVHPLLTYRVWETFLMPKVAAMTGLVIAYALDTEAQQIFEKYWSFNRGYADKLYSPTFIKRHHEVVRIGAGANMAFRKSIFEQTGYFDERLDVGAAGCNGDSEMWYRILAAGSDIYYNPRAIVFHEHRKELQALQKQLYNYMRGFAAAGLIQQEQNKTGDFKKHLYYSLPRYYLNQLTKGFPRYRFRYRTLLSEIRGVLSGILYFYTHRKTPSQSHFK